MTIVVHGTSSSTQQPTVTIIIPVRQINAYVRETVNAIAELPQRVDGMIEIIVLPDHHSPSTQLSGPAWLHTVPSGPVGPAQKRDLGAQFATGTFLAFLDDDAYPTKGWLTAALPHFQNESTAAVGGPTLTPPTDPFWQQTSGWVLASLIGSGGARIRYVAGAAPRDVDDWPSVNLLVRKSDFEAVGGFNCAYYPGEDTKLCLDLTKRLGKRIIFEPGALVFHHRRPLFWGHFQQIGQYAIHRGFFVKAYPQTSRRLSYFLPSILALGLLGGLPFAVLSRRLRRIYLLAVGTYTLALAVTGTSVGIRARSPALGVAVAFAVAMTHLWYGLLFIRGMVKRELAS